MHYNGCGYDIGATMRAKLSVGFPALQKKLAPACRQAGWHSEPWPFNIEASFSFY